MLTLELIFLPWLVTAYFGVFWKEKFVLVSFLIIFMTFQQRILKLNPVQAETTWSNESDNFLPVVREADLSTGSP